jgi:hypothetical protein
MLLGLALGLGSAFLMIDGDYPFGAVRAGPWQVWPRVGSRDIDPYARAIVARRGDLPLGAGEGLEFTATTDSSGRNLSAQCSYRVARTTPVARHWTLTVYDERGRSDRTLGRSSLTSSELLRDEKGEFTVTVSPDVASGNWLRMPSSGRVSLVLRLYETPVSAGAAVLDPATLPAIERVGC